MWWWKSIYIQIAIAVRRRNFEKSPLCVNISIAFLGCVGSAGSSLNVLGQYVAH